MLLANVAHLDFRKNIWLLFQQMLMPEGRQLTQDWQPPIPNVTLLVIVDVVIEKVVIVRVDDDVMIIDLRKKDRFERLKSVSSSLKFCEDSISADEAELVLSMWRI